MADSDKHSVKSRKSRTENISSRRGQNKKGKKTTEGIDGMLDTEHQMAHHNNSTMEAIPDPRVTYLEDRLIPLKPYDDEVWEKATCEHEEELNYLKETTLATARWKEIMALKAEMADSRQRSLCRNGETNWRSREKRYRQVKGFLCLKRGRRPS